MRYIICHEGQETIPDRYIPEGTLTWKRDRIPVSLNFDVHQLGWAKDIRREDDGILTAEIVFFDKKLKIADDQGFSVYIAPVKYHMWKDVAWCTEGNISGVSLIGYRHWPLHNE